MKKNAYLKKAQITALHMLQLLTQNSYGTYSVLLYVCVKYVYIFFSYQTSENMLNKENEINVGVTLRCAGDPKNPAEFPLPVLCMWKNSIKGLLTWISMTELLDLPKCYYTSSFL